MRVSRVACWRCACLFPLFPFLLAVDDRFSLRFQPPFVYDHALHDYDYGDILVDEHINDYAYDFLLGVLAYRPTERLSVARMKSHPVFRGM